MIKNFLFKLKEDLKTVFRYPAVDLSNDYRVDYDKYWSKRRKGNISALSSWQKQRADHILNMIKPGTTVMDIGCGDGALLKYLMDQKQVKGIGIDMSAPILEKAKELNIETHLVDLRNEDSVKSLPEVDYILGLEILEHMPEPEVLIMNLKDKARMSMIFSFPNTGYYTYRLRMLLGRFPLQWLLYPGEHLRFWTVTDVKWWLKSLGFVCQKIVLYEGVPGLKNIFPSVFGQGIIIQIHDRKE